MTSIHALKAMIRPCRLITWATLMCVSSPAMSDPSFLDCRATGKSGGYQHLVFTIDLESNSIRWQHFYDTGKEDLTYQVSTVTDSEVFGELSRDGLLWRLTINRVSLRWLVQFQVDKSANANLWNKQDDKIGYPPDEQITMAFGGICEKSAPKF